MHHMNDRGQIVISIDELFDEPANPHIEVRATGAGLYRLRVDHSRSTDVPVVLDVPLGTMFVPREGESAQRMIAPTHQQVSVAKTSWHTLFHVVCSDFYRAIPRGKTSFTAVPEPHNEHLLPVLEVLDDQDASLRVRQIATWVITDDIWYRRARLLSFTHDEILHAVYAIIVSGFDLQQTHMFRNACMSSHLLEVIDPRLRDRLVARSGLGADREPDTSLAPLYVDNAYPFERSAGARRLQAESLAAEAGVGASAREVKRIFKKI